MSHVAEAPQITVEIDPLPVPPPRRWAARVCAAVTHSATVLILLTLFGGAIRFWKLNQPALWGDEVQTFRRVCGTYQQLVDALATGGFTPLHYLLYYWIRQHMMLTPTVMRLPTALFGTLLIPAIYFLARQIVRPPVALLAAALTACSAYQLNFSRDAKMYSDLWLFTTIHMASFLWWLRTRSAVAWWAWVAAGTAMLGVQLVGAAVLPIELLMLITAPRGNWRCIWPLTRFAVTLPAAALAVPMTLLERLLLLDRSALRRPAMWWAAVRESFADARRWRRRCFIRFAWPTIVLFLLGVGLLGAAPCAYYVKFNPFFNRVYDSDRESFNWFRTGIGWVSSYNAGRDGPDLIRYTTTAFGLGWEWPREQQWKAVNERTGRLLVGASTALLVFVMFGALPLTRRRSWQRRRSVLWLAIWIGLPAYAFYCASMPHAASPLDWVTFILLKKPPAIAWPKLPVAASEAATVENWLHPGTWHAFFVPMRQAFGQARGGFTRDNLNFPIVIGGLVAIAAWSFATLRMNRRSLFVAAQMLLTIVGLLLLCVLLRLAIDEPFPQSVWIPRYLGFVWPAFAIAVAALFWRLPTRPVRWLGIAVLLIANLAVGGARVLAGSEPPTEIMARDIIDSQPPLHSRLFSLIPPQNGSEPGTGVLESLPARYYLAIYSGKPVTPDEIHFGSGFENHFLIGRPRFLNPLVNQIRNIVKDATIDRLVVWDELHIGQIDQSDPTAAALPDDWRKTSESSYVGRDHWTWTDYYVHRRRVYEKAAGSR